MELIFDPPLEKDVDYMLNTRSSTHMQLMLRSGRKWRSDGEPGPLKLRRIDTGAGDLRIDAKYGGVTVAEVQVDLGAHGVTVESAADHKLYQGDPEVTVRGSGFNNTISLNTLKWGNSLRGKGVNYTITKGVWFCSHTVPETRFGLAVEPGEPTRALKAPYGERRRRPRAGRPYGGQEGPHGGDDLRGPGHHGEPPADRVSNPLMNCG